MAHRLTATREYLEGRETNAFSCGTPVAVAGRDANTNTWATSATPGLHLGIALYPFSWKLTAISPIMNFPNCRSSHEARGIVL